MINNTTLMGRLTADPELKKTPNNVSVTTIRLAVERSIVSKDGERITDFITCVAWRGTAEFICKYFRKGQLLAVIGELHTQNYEDKQGNKRTSIEVVVREASFCGDGANTKRTVVVEPREVGTVPPLPAEQENAPDEYWVPDEDLPF